MKERLSIGEVADRAGVAPSALRYYEAERLLPEPERVSGRRAYDPGVVRRVAVIQACRAAGFTIREIRALVGATAAGVAPGEAWRQVAEAKLAEVAALEARAADMRRWLEEGLACGCLRIEDCALAERAQEEMPNRLARQMSPLEGPATSRKRRTRSLG
ncbi:MAG TPA: MerR family transcriptional regulator [Actinomycetota bacterium]|nr:MerR family transcriptional regulator [Actinomycetota bacterium]